MHHSPLVMVAKLGARWAALGAVLFILTSPVTIGAALAVYDSVTGSDFGTWLLGSPPPYKPATVRGTVQTRGI